MFKNNDGIIVQKRNICTTNSENSNQSSSACMMFTMNKKIISYADLTFELDLK